MNTSRVAWLSMLAATSLVVACGDDAQEDKPGGTTASTTTSGNGGDGTGATGNGGNGTGGQGTGGTAPTSCSTDAKPLEEITANITANTTLTADKDWLLKGIIQVKSGATLTIEPCTVVRGDKATLATLVIEPGAKIMAEGEADKPIVFTSLAEPGDRAAGDWGGLILLGRAPINQMGGTANVEGITGEGTSYGGNDPNDNSGVLKYVRIEFSGVLLSPDNEVNGLTMAGVGSKTTIDYVMVHDTLDDCFEFFGGTVNAKHLVCANNGDDGFDWDNGYKGRLQFIALQQDPNVADDTNGFEGDNDAAGSANTPTSEPTIYNATLCGKNVDVDKSQFGMLLRRSTKAHIFNTVASGFEAGVDIRDPLTSVEIKNSIFFGNLAANVAYNEDGSDTGVHKDDDAGLDEVAFITDAANKNSEIDPKITDCFGATPNFTPMATLSTDAATPPDDGFFDATASHVGAFKAGENWAFGAWVDYSRN